MPQEDVQVSNHDWEIGSDGIIRCAKCYKFVSEGVEGECYAEEHPRADCEGCHDPECPCNTHAPLECLNCGALGPSAKIGADHAGWHCGKCYSQLQRGEL